MFVTEINSYPRSSPPQIFAVGSIDRVTLVSLYLLSALTWAENTDL